MCACDALAGSEWFVAANRPICCYSDAWAGKPEGHVMAKGQLRSNKEKKKPKAEWNKKKKGGPAPQSSTVGQLQSAATKKA